MGGRVSQFADLVPERGGFRVLPPHWRGRRARGKQVARNFILISLVRIAVVVALFYSRDRVGAWAVRF